MMKIIQKIGAKRIAVVLVLFVVAFLSINVFSKAASNPENHTKTIESLDEKKADAFETDSGLSGWHLLANCGNPWRCYNTCSK